MSSVHIIIIVALLPISLSIYFTKLQLKQFKLSVSGEALIGWSIILPFFLCGIMLFFLAYYTHQKHENAKIKEYHRIEKSH